MSASSSPSTNANNTNNAWYRFFLFFPPPQSCVSSYHLKKCLYWSKRIYLWIAESLPNYTHRIQQGDRRIEQLVDFPFSSSTNVGAFQRPTSLSIISFAHAAQFSILDRDQYGMRICLVSSLVGWTRWLVVFSKDERKRYSSVSLTNQGILTEN
jgi:hypothetical protein